MINILTVVGVSIISGLLGAVVTLIAQWKNNIKQQKINIFQTLLANRYQITADANVQVINVIDVVFYHHKNVRESLNCFVEATKKVPLDTSLIITAYLKLLEAMSKAIGMKKLDWDRINRCYYHPIALAEREQENNLLRKTMLQNQLNLSRHNDVGDGIMSGKR